MIRLLLVDDQALVRRGIAGLLALTPDLVVVGEAADGDEALERIADLAPDVVLLDVRMPRRSGIEVLELLAAEGRSVAAILLTTFDDDEALLQGICAGARGFLLKDVAFETLVEAIRAVARGESWIRPAVTEQVLRGLDRLRPRFERLDLPDPLTPREREVLRLLAGGYSNREIAEFLGTSEGTTKNHISAILSKLGVRDRTRAVLRGLELGLI